MKKYYLIFLCVIIVVSQIRAQLTYKYTSDSTTLSIVFDSGFKFNNANPFLTVSLKDKWKFKLSDSVSITINGALQTTGKSNRIAFEFNLSGNRFTTKIRSGNFSFTKKIPVAQVLKNPAIRCNIPQLRQNKGAAVWLDVIDITAL